MLKSDIKNAFMDLQDHICSRLEVLDQEGKFREDAWERPGGGGGRTVMGPSGRGRPTVRARPRACVWTPLLTLRARAGGCVLR